MMKAPIDKIYTHNGNFPAGTSGRVSVFWAGGFSGAAE